MIGAGAHGAGLPRLGRACWTAASDSFATVNTAAEDPALLIYTSGTTGQPKGALHAHRMMLGCIPAMEQTLSHWPRGNEIMWTPAEWAWIAGLYDALFPAWYYGTPVLAHRFAKFDPERAFAHAGKTQGRRELHPTHRAQDDAAGEPADASGGTTRSAPSSPAARRWARNCWRGAATPFGTTISEGYGQTEMNLMTLELARLVSSVRPGSCGRACPGRKVAIVDGDGNVLPPGEDGQIAGWRHDPIVMLEYWKATRRRRRSKYAGDWLLTGDLGRIDEDGYVFFKSRDDDVITSGGYRIGPGEIEECLMKHPRRVAMVGRGRRARQGAHRDREGVRPAPARDRGNRRT